MSMLSSQCDELREAARQFEGYQNGEISRMLREAADTIETLRGRLQRAEEDARIIEVETSHIDIEQGEVITRFVPAELDYIEDKSRWFELFGTPERVARTLANNCHRDGCIACAAMGFDCGGGDYDALLEWLKGGSE